VNPKSYNNNYKSNPKDKVTHQAYFELELSFETKQE